MNVPSTHRVFLVFAVVAALSACRDAPSPSESVLDAQAELVWHLGAGEPPEEPWFGEARDVAVAGDRIFVADQQRVTVVVLDADGNFLNTIGSQGQGPGEFQQVRFLAPTQSADVYVATLPVWMVDRFTPDGEFVERTDHRQLIREGRDENADGVRIGEPVIATDDSSFVWAVSVPRDAPAGEQLETPPLLAISGGQWGFIGTRALPDGSDEVRRDLIESPDQTLISNFTRGEPIEGTVPGEVIFVRNSDPYTVFRVEAGQAARSFAYVEPERSSWVQRLDTPIEEWRERRQADDWRYVGEHIILQPQRPPAVNHAFTFTHSLRGLARQGTRLFVYVEVLKEGFVDQRTDAMVEKKIYVVDLEAERLEMVIPIDVPELVRLEGALSNGTLVFAALFAAPSIYVYRIVAAG